MHINLKIYNFKVLTKFKVVNEKQAYIQAVWLGIGSEKKIERKFSSNYIWHELKEKIKSFSKQTLVAIYKYIRIVFFFCFLTNFMIYMFYACHAMPFNSFVAWNLKCDCRTM